MTRDELSAAVVSALTQVALDVDPETASGSTRLREDLDLDSLDFLDVIAAVHQSTGIEIAERDYGELATLDSFVDYLDRTR